jgi:uncharacterized protein (TIGR02145 family)
MYKAAKIKEVTIFSGLPGGFRFFNGYFLYIGSYGDWWSSTEYSAGSAYGRYLVRSGVYLYSYSTSKEEGLSVRCLRA